MKRIYIFIVLLVSVVVVKAARYTVGFDDIPLGTEYTMMGVGNATVVANPNGAGRVLKVTCGEYNSVPQIDVQLPGDNTLDNCTAINVKMYIPSSGNEQYANYKQLLVYINGNLQYKNVDSSGADAYPKQGDKDSWFTKTVTVDEFINTTSTNGSFSIAIGLNDNKMTYYIGEISLSYELNLENPELPKEGAFFTGKYRNLFAEAGYSEAQIQQRIDELWKTYFEGDKSNERLYYESGSDMAYILDVNNDDVRSEGMSYGMMICLQLNKKAEFDKLWKWAKTYMQFPVTDERRGYFAWQCKSSGEKKGNTPASDGEEYFITALMLASNRWGDGEGIYNYSKEANYILEMSAEKPAKDVNPYSSYTPLFDAEAMQVVFVPYASAAKFSDPSYHLPAFYELWARWADTNNDLYRGLAAKSRELFPRFANSKTGLMPDYSNFDGTPHNGDGDHSEFLYDAWRCIMNMAIDFAWFCPEGVDYTELINRQYAFFKSKGITQYHSVYTLDGGDKNGNTDHSPGLVACNASGALATDSKDAWLFIENFFDTGIPTGRYRYYDGCLYFLNWLNCAGRYRIYHPGGESGVETVACDATVGLSFKGGIVSVSADSMVSIYDLSSGICVATRYCIAGEGIKIADFAHGLYVARAGDELLKFCY